MNNLSTAEKLHRKSHMDGHISQFVLMMTQSHLTAQNSKTSKQNRTVFTPMRRFHQGIPFLCLSDESLSDESGQNPPFSFCMCCGDGQAI
jgi:hypothetical protein